MTPTSQNLLDELIITAFAPNNVHVACISRHELELFKAQSQIGTLRENGIVIEKLEVEPTELDDVVIATFTVDLINPF